MAGGRSIRLTPRQREVAALVAEGLTNREIARKLFISERTADGHLEQLRNLLGVSSRAQIAAWMTQEGLTSASSPVEQPDSRATPIRELPSGTVTLVFSDIEGSTRLLHEQGERYPELLAEHRRLLREAFARRGGIEVDTHGDAFFYAFSRASDALAAAGEAQQALASTPIRVRIGVHTGEPTITEEDYVGIDVHKAARIMGAGHGGQVVVSEQTARIAPAGLVDLGVHRLKDLSAPERIYQVGAGEFPRLRTLYQTNLPVPANPLVGRRDELADVRDLLSRDGPRVVTVTGPGGIGKTRFALAAAGETAEAFPGGIWFIDLTPLRDPALVLPAVAHVVGAEGELARHLGAVRCLLVLDNFEQVVEASADVAALLAACPQLRMLVTSRELLRIAAERGYALPPLAESPAVELFRQRALAAFPEVEIREAVAAEICRRLDGLPLAIELAAARVKVFEPEALLARLERRLPLLVSRARDLPERQRTLDSTIAWSYELLPPGEQQLFLRLAVFAGGATLAAIEAVAEGDAGLVESLVDKSLLRRRRERFVMLETIREFALERFAESPEAEHVRRRHAEFFLAVAKSANLNSGKMAPGGQHIDMANAEQNNIRAALAWAIASRSVGLGLELATAMESFWVAQDPREGMRWFAALFEHPEAEAVAPDVRAHALRAYGSSSDIAGHDEAAERLYEQSLALFERLGDDHGRGFLLLRLGIQAMRRSALERARELVEASHEIFEQEDDGWRRTFGQMLTTGTLGAIARDAGDYVRAFEQISRSAALAREVVWYWWEAGMLAELATLSLRAGGVDEGEVRARESLAIAEQERDRAGRVFGVGLLARVAAERGQLDRAGRLWGAIEEENAVAPLGGWRRHRDVCEARILEAAGPEFESARAAGATLTLDEAVESALGHD
jgi:predicted ATPase/class 3 adenylate cyclase